MSNIGGEVRSRVSSTPGPLARRPRRLALRDIAFITFIELYLFVFIVSFPLSKTGYDGRGVFSESLAVAVDLGQAALTAAGWGIGVLVTALLGFFAITVGGNYLYRESDDLNLQMRYLALVAELIASTAVFCTLLITAYCLFTPVELGQLLFVIPAVLVIVFVAVEVGAYLAPEPEKVIANALRMRAWARAKALKLRPQPPHGPLETLFTNSAAIAFVGLSIALPDNDWVSTSTTYGALLVTTALVAWCCTSVRSVSHATRDRFSVIISWVALAFFYLLLAVITVVLISGDGVRLGIIVAYIALACAVSTWFPRRNPALVPAKISSWLPWQWLYEWSLAGGSLAGSIKSLEKTDQRAADSIAKAKIDIARRTELIKRDAPKG